MSAMSPDVVIIGAGPTGLTLANILGRAGRSVVLVERNPSTVGEPRAVSIDDESLRTMQAIGLAGEVIKDVALDYGSYYVDAAGKRFAAVEPSTREYGFPRRNAFTQPMLEATLRRGLDRFPNVTTLFQHECLGFVDKGDRVSIELRDPSGGSLSVDAAFLVGCDGARSATRKAIGATLTGSTYRERWLIVDLASTKEQLRQTRVVCDPARPLISLPGPGGIRRYEFMLRDDEADDKASSIDFARKLLAAHGPDAEAPIARCQVYTFHARICDIWSRGRVFLAGDAAHLSPPFAGQGMNSGLRDAHNLGWKLVEVLAGRLGPRLLDTYQAERAPHASSLIELAIRLGHVMMPTSRVQAFAVQSAFRLAGLVPKVQSYFADMKYKPKPFYGRGFVAAAAGDSTIVGRMIPQPEVDRADRGRVMLDELLGQEFALVAFGPDAQRAVADAAGRDFGIPVKEAIAVLPRWLNADADAPDAGTTVRDVNGAMKAFANDRETTVMLVRPDRYIAVAAGFTSGGMEEMAARARDLIANARA